jgi:hypothetical protein
MNRRESATANERSAREEALVMPRLIQQVTTGLLALVALCMVVLIIVLAYPVVYGNRIYPGVSVDDVPLGGLTVEEATSLLSDRLPDPEIQGVELRAGDHSWRLSWAEMGQGYAIVGTATAAYRVGRDGPWIEQVLSPWRIRRTGRSMEPHAVPASEAKVQARLEEVASLIYAPPIDAQLHISAEGVTSAPSQPGRALDVEASSASLLQGLRDGATEVELTLVDLPPRLLEPEPAATLARSLLAEPFTLLAEDPLTDYHSEFRAPQTEVARWLEAVPVGEKMLLELDEGAVRNWLLGVAPQLGSERILDVEETLTRTLGALNAGEHQARSAIRHPEGTYVVQPGDVLFDIAYRHGFPQWRVEEANPDVAPDELLIGMELTIPSIDVLFPEPLVPGKRIEIDLPEQRLRAYEDDAQVFEFTCSSGISTTPTIAGQFQVLFKEPQAYAQRWSLEMPYFMAIYYEGPDFANGIHELPIRDDGHRLWAGYLGWPASYGCIILDIGDAERLYSWAPVGTLVRIEGVAPGTPTIEERPEQETE